MLHYTQALFMHLLDMQLSLRTSLYDVTHSEPAEYLYLHIPGLFDRH